jgi:hypothetical protein
MNTARRAGLALIVASLAVSLTGCGTQHATVADCVTYLTKQVAAQGQDPTLVAEDMQRQCEQNKSTMTPEEFDRFRG